ncbi:MAG: hypothetical protein WCP89_02380 [archaeon]
MDLKKFSAQALIIIISTIVLAITVSTNNLSLSTAAGISFLIILSSNFITKYIVAYILESKISISFWSIYQFGLRKDSHFKRPVPMIWLPIILAFITRGMFWWLGVLSFDVEPRTERVAKRHGLYRFTQMTEWHIAWIAAFGIIVNLTLAIIGYLLGFELFAKLNIYFAVWSLIPLSDLDGNKILMASRIMWFVLAVIVAIFFGFALITV